MSAEGAHLAAIRSLGVFIDPWQPCWVLRDHEINKLLVTGCRRRRRFFFAVDRQQPHGLMRGTAVSSMVPYPSQAGSCPVLTFRFLGKVREQTFEALETDRQILPRR